MRYDVVNDVQSGGDKLLGDAELHQQLDRMQIQSAQNVGDRLQKTRNERWYDTLYNGLE